MNNFYGWFAGLATISGLAYFLLGFGTAYAVHAAKQKMSHRAPVRIPWQLAGIAVGTAAILIVTFQSSVAYNLANETAQEVQQCQKEFNSVLQARAQIGEENDAWSRTQRTAIGDWLREILLPPPEIAALRDTAPNDLRVQKWSIAVTVHYSQIIQRAQKEQDRNLAERARHPLPDPTCGK